MNSSTSLTPLYGDEKFLFKQYEDVLFESILSAFGLNALFDKTDQRGGTVDTIHNAREGVYSKQYDNEKKYKEHIENIGNKFDRDAYNKNKDFIEKGREYKKDQQEGILIDGYTGKEIPLNAHVDREHIISAHEIEKDPGRFLSGFVGDELASDNSNLAPVERSINRSKGKKSVEEYISWLNEKRSSHEEEFTQLNNKKDLSDKERKRKETLEQLLSVDEERMREKDRIARQEYNKKINLKYYMGKEFLSHIGAQALKSGYQMGKKQTLGLVFMEVIKAIRTEWPNLMETWRKHEGFGSKLANIKDFLTHVKEVIKNAFQSIKERWKDLLASFKDGFISGILSSITTTIINIFTTTARRVMGLLRQFWSSIIGAVKIMRSDSYTTREEKTLAVMKFISLGVAAALQPIIAEVVDKFLTPYIPSALLRDIISGFMSSFCSGVIGVTLVYFIDHSPVVQKILTATGDIFVAAVDIIVGIGEVTKDALIYAYNTIKEITASTVTYCLERANAPLLKIGKEIQKDISEVKEIAGSIDQRARLINHKLDEQSLVLNQISNGIDSLTNKIDNLTNLTEEGFIKTHKMIDTLTDVAIKNTKEIIDTIDNKEEARKLEKFRLAKIALIDCYQTCINNLKRNGTVREADLQDVIRYSRHVTSWLEDRLNIDFLKGDGHRLSVISSYILALQIADDVRCFLAENTACDGKKKFILNILLEEIAFRKKQTLFELVSTESGDILKQYVLLHRAVKNMLEPSNSLQLIERADISLFQANPSLFIWNDGLDELREIIAQIKDTPPSEEPEIVMHVTSEEERKSINKYISFSGNVISVSDLKNAFGIPHEKYLRSELVFRLFVDAHKIKKDYQLALKKENIQVAA